MTDSIQMTLQIHNRRVIEFPRMSADGHRLISVNIRNTVRVLSESPVRNQK